MGKIKALSFLFIFSLMACSSGEKLKKEKNQIAVFEGGLYLNESGEDGIMELVIPEVNEYTEVKERAEEKSNMESLELGAEQVDEVEIDRTIASIGQEEIVPEPEMETVDDAPVENYADSNEEYAAAELDDTRFEEYKVQKNDSLMLISFKLYNNFDKWKELAENNNISESNNYQIEVGQKIRAKLKHGDGTTWQPQGNPYLIRVGDFLGKISQNVYEGRARFWYDIWKNNEVLIKNPNTVYVGFTIYTQPIDVVFENERKRMKQYKKKYKKSIRRRDLAGALDEKANI